MLQVSNSLYKVDVHNKRVINNCIFCNIVHILSELIIQLIMIQGIFLLHSCKINIQGSILYRTHKLFCNINKSAFKIRFACVNIMSKCLFSNYLYTLALLSHFAYIYNIYINALMCVERKKYLDITKCYFYVTIRIGNILKYIAAVEI